MEVWSQIIAGKVCRTEVLPRPRSFRRGSVPAHCRGRRPRRPAILFPKGIFRASERGSLLAAATCRLFPCMPPAGNVPRPRARVTFGRSPKSDQKVCLKPQVSRLPARLPTPQPAAAYPAKAQMLQIVVQRITCTSLPAAAPTSRTEIPPLAPCIVKVLYAPRHICIRLHSPCPHPPSPRGGFPKGGDAHVPLPLAGWGIGILPLRRRSLVTFLRPRK